MTQSRCASPLSFERFLDYWFGELSAAEQQPLEEHLFECETCAASAAAWSNDTFALAERGAAELPRAFLTRQQLAALGEQAVVVDVPRLPRVDVRLSETAIQVFRVVLEPELLASIERLDVEYLKEGRTEPIFHVAVIPLVTRTGEVLLACHRHVLSAHGDTTMRLVGTQGEGRRTLFETEVHFV